jgi:hypothetical protein
MASNQKIAKLLKPRISYLQAESLICDSIYYSHLNIAFFRNIWLCLTTKGILSSKVLEHHLKIQDALFVCSFLSFHDCVGLSRPDDVSHGLIDKNNTRNGWW